MSTAVEARAIRTLLRSRLKRFRELLRLGVLLLREHDERKPRLLLRGN